ncbi:unnamed protein product [Pleuronectes platessa]|uniref:Uncharacterized protein n=1 Tax=Pleuronectes platessa TaxID=8262 RepID=A0A9N7UUJ7_PLEPL|nr:unnamed protein product [Pleuronectes platessa]
MSGFAKLAGIEPLKTGVQVTSALIMVQNLKTKYPGKQHRPRLGFFANKRTRWHHLPSLSPPPHLCTSLTSLALCSEAFMRRVVVFDPLSSFKERRPAVWKDAGRPRSEPIAAGEYPTAPNKPSNHTASNDKQGKSEAETRV